MKAVIAHRYETLDARRCWYCSTDDSSFGGFSVREGRLICAQCRNRLNDDVIRYTRAFSLFRAMKGTRDEPLKHLISRRTRMYWDIKDLKDKGEVARLPFLGAALSKTFEALMSDELQLETTIIVPLPNYDPKRDHVARIVAAANSPWQVRPVLECVRQGSLRKDSMGADDRFDARANAYSCSADLTGVTVLVVDDIFISGATLSGAAATCLARGAGAVYGITVARLVQPDLTDFDIAAGKIRLREWCPPAADGGRWPPEGANHLLVRFTCRHCPERVVAGPWVWPGAYTFACSCGGRYSIDITDRRGRLTIRVPGCRPEDLQVTFRKEASA